MKHIPVSNVLRIKNQNQESKTSLIGLISLASSTFSLFSFIDNFSGSVYSGCLFFPFIPQPTQSDCCPLTLLKCFLLSN